MNEFISCAEHHLSTCLGEHGMRDMIKDHKNSDDKMCQILSGEMVHQCRAMFPLPRSPLFFQLVLRKKEAAPPPLSHC